ncbi:McrB family protein [Campylobacter jejuni]|uniref:McrB family protein n=1 Tax=Campylobacter jejuni TaxID=197 RepID=UPI0012D25F73|nr:AAA family ATPase [Campylobacter jejuni]ECK7553902.1 AAA family ATPase [Campylobacter jejuni]ECK8013575.1 AAA family ATPase [Campylobacter jejuni]ECL2404918.1 AAA family ATPase [Campylobacter jejuni]ECL3717668.1 AAA family ATPase [Campylobacter jejuni]ECL9090983.1 AAA domain-containing protein [Campylobacter jejuni]
MKFVEFNFSNGEKIQTQIKESNEENFRAFLEKRLKNFDQYIKATKGIIEECKRLNIVNRDDFDTFQINSIELLKKLLFELKKGLLQEYNNKSGNGCPHACINSHYLEFVKYVNAYKEYTSKDMVKYLKTRGGDKEFKVEIKNQKIEVIASVDNIIRTYSLERFLRYSVLGKIEEDSSYAKPLFEDILNNSNLSIIKLSENEKIYKEQHFENEKILSENQNLSLNQILYGPPGTGKTYHTIDKALEILGENLESRDEKKAKFDEYVKNGQIVFTTFHQSYGYEEFVEGIKPIIDNDENSQEVKYDVKDGIFKELCEKALENRDSIKNFNFYIDKLKEKVKIDDNNPEKYFELPNTKYSIQYRNGKTFRIKFDDMSKNHKDYPVSIDNIEKLYKTSNIDEIYNSAYVRAILNYLKLQGLEDYKEKDEKVNLPYIIIIDEINRGNVSKIFGELITLIEPSKRIGEKEELKVTLPYSGEKFGVPKNVYIIGTMNTADRSITSLDTALRRRFEFVEMMPDPDLLKNVFICKDVENPNKDEDYLGDDAKTEGFAEILQNILISINKRIEFLLDREKTIGHAFFMSEAVKFNKDNWCKPDEYEEDWYVLSISKLKSIFQNKIIPLLQEYFYNDYALISAVLNDNGMIEKCEKDDKYLQKIKNLDNVDSEKIIYNIASFDNKIWNDIKTYQAIYNDGENQSKNDKQ